MNFPKANSFPTSIMRERSMGPNPLKLCEELLGLASIPAGSVVLDLGSGAGLTSALLARECGLTVYAADLWSDPSDNMRFFEGLGLTNRQVVPLKADATALPFATEFFDAVVSVDSYNYFGRDPEYLGAHLLPLVKRGGELLFAIPAWRATATTTCPRACSRPGRPSSWNTCTTWTGGGPTSPRPTVWTSSTCARWPARARHGPIGSLATTSTLRGTARPSKPVRSTI